MVERIIEAGRAVLLEEGYDAFSTNRVAAAAEVSPGSLYQYFPDKGAILDEVIDRYLEEVSERVAASLSDRIGQSGPEMIRDTADALVTALEADRPLLRVVAEELPASRHRQRRDQLERRVRELMTAYLAGHADAIARPDPAAASWILVLALENLAVRWVLAQPAVDRARLIEEISALVSGYLLSPDESVESSSGSS